MTVLCDIKCRQRQKFDKDFSPVRRYYKDSDATNVTPPNVLDEDLNASSPDCAQRDVIWEAFWAHRVVHPFAKYQVANKARAFKVLQHAKIRVQPSNLTEEYNMHHMVDIFVGAGGIHNAASDKRGDTKDITSVNERVVPPLQASTDVAGQHFGEFGHAYNQVVRSKQILPFDQDKEKDQWLMIWCDHIGGVASTGDQPCTFDMQVRSKFAMEMNKYTFYSETVPGPYAP